MDSEHCRNYLSPGFVQQGNCDLQCFGFILDKMQGEAIIRQEAVEDINLELNWLEEEELGLVDLGVYY